MGKLIYSMTVSLDGYICDRAGEIDWTTPSDELHRAFNELTASSTAEICGRHEYEIMRVWDDPAFGADDPTMAEFQRLWARLPKVVFSRTLTAVEGNARLAQGDLATEVAALTAEGDVGIGGADIAGQAIALDLVDEFRPMVAPVLLGGGKPFFPSLQHRLPLELVERRDFPGGVTGLTYVRQRS